MSIFGINYDIGYHASPKTVQFTNSGTQGVYTCNTLRYDLPHVITSNVDILVEGSGRSDIDTARSFYLPANTPMTVRPDRTHPYILYQRTNSTAFNTTAYVTIALVVKDSVPDAYTTTLVHYLDGTFSRASVGTYLTSASTVTTASANIIRLENRGDVTLPLLEGLRTNYITYSNDISNWSQHDSTTTANYGVAPDGTTTASRVQINYANDFGPYKQLTVAASKIAISGWMKNTTGAGDEIRFSFGQANGPPNGLSFVGSSAWQYGATAGAVTPDTDNYLFNGQLNKPTTGNPALPISDTLNWGIQLEQANFPSSLIQTSGATALRNADSLTFTTSQYNATEFCNTGGDFAFYPTWIGTDPVLNETMYLFSFGDADNGIRARQTAGGLKVEAVVGGSVVLSSAQLTFSRFQRIAVEIRPALGTLTISGATSGNGTTSAAGFAFPETNLRMGGVYGGTSEAFARISNVTLVV